ncbi:NRPS [Trichoderma virens]|nr:NRPS [Trichoderma virens]
MGLLRVERTDYPRELSVVDVFQQQVTATPTRTAIKDRSGSVTYTQLDERSNKIASWLLGQSLAPETLIGVLSSRCSETVIAFMGILKANLAYLPLDTKTPDYRMKAIISCIMGRKIILLGPETEAPADPGEIEYVRISQVLDGASKNNDISSEPIGHISPSATSLAHVLFTSGSTGQPKGVMINHRGIVRLVKQSGIMTYVPPGGVTAHISNIAFDAATWEIYSAILNGGKLVCIDEMTVLDYASMSEICIRENVQTALFTTAVFKEYARNAPELMASLSAVFVGGERLDPNDLPPSLRAIAGKIIHLYGPTENTTVSTMYCLQRAEYCSNGVPIGRAVSNSGAVVMDSKQCLVPLGVIGELVVFGDGLARGYLNPQLDEGRFVLIQIGDESVRGYRTGDHVRQRLDGQLEFLGRIDGQVKIRGQRVELGEVECALRSHKLVHDAIAVLHYGDTDGNSDDARIAGFVTTSAELEDEAQNGDESQIVSMWKDRYDADSYTGFNDIRPEAYGRDFTGWTSMFDGKDIDKAEMNEWLDDTIATILSGGPPGHVLEVGSGSGMILLNILDGLQSYVGLDPSERANNLIGKMSKSLPELNNKVTMYKATAADVCRLEKAAAPPDLVILNSVAQHFPSQEYLYQFVEDLLQLGTEMTLFFGDIRSYALHKDFLAARALRMAGDEVKLDTIRRMVADMERIESELLVDPAFFTGLVSRLPDRIEHVEIIPKKMRATNELSCYRYTAVVHVKAGGHQASATAIKKQIRHIPQSDWIDFVERGLDRGSLLHLIRASLDSSTSALAISNIPYTKTILERHMVESIRTEKSNDFVGNWVSHMRQRAESCAHLSVTDLHALAEEAGYSVEISWARQYSQRGGLDAVFHQYASDKRKGRILFDFPTDYQNRPYASLSSHPLKHQIRQKTQEQLYELAKTQLPQYMIPQSITILDSMPVNENGKIDRRALPNSLAEALHKEHTTPFDLRKDPGWRVSVFKMGDEHHVLSIVMHHIICDGWSLDVLRKELAILYSAALHGKDPLSAIEPLAVQYSDHALWQRQQDQIDEHNRQLEYWVTQLETSRPAELLCDKLRPSTISGRAGLHELRIEGTIYKNLQEFCRKYQVTPFMVLFAVFRAAHYRLTGVEDATIGTANACRDHWELKDMIGLFVNMQCIRTKVENTTTLEGLIREVQAMVTASFAHQDVPFESIVSALRKERDLSRSPLVQIVFALHSQLNLAEFALEDIETELMTPPMGSRFDLEFHLYQEKHGLKGQIMFSTDLFNLNTIDNLTSVFLRILKQGLASPSAAIESLPLMTKEEYAKLNSMKLLEMETTDYPRNYSIIEVFQQQVSATPDKVAVRDGPTSLTYSQLDDKSNRLAQWLHKRSFASESLVGVLASRSHLTIIAYLGVLKACLAYLPLDPTSPLGRTEAILSSVKDCKLILVGPDAENHAKLLDSVDSESITSILECPADSNGCILKPLNNIFPSPNNLAYVMFTSGSTGRPKGVMIQHRGILRLVENKKMVQNMSGAVNTAHIGNVTFDASTWEIYPTLLNGGTLICFSSMELLDYKTLPKAFADESVQAMFITPALLRQYLVHCPDLFRRIHILYIGGDRLDPEDAFATLRVTTGKVINAYGPTENTCISTYFHVSSPNPENCVNGVPIGRVFPNSGAFVMDSRQQLVPLGVVGELVVTGDGLAGGYTDPNYDLNRFISITIAGNETRAYRTGDYVRYRPEDGQLEFFGRMDNQIKIRGQRLELGEIEHGMLSHNAVNEAAVVIRQSGEASQEATIDGFITLFEHDHALDVLLNDEQEYQQIQVSDVKSNIQAHGSFDEVQQEAVGQDVLGWTSMLDGGKIDKNELNEWLDDTMHTMLNGDSPKEVLEIGTGSGMILINLPSSLQKYVGLEPSERNIEVIKKLVESNPSLNSKIQMYQATAKDLNQLHLLISPDLVILNSIVQYFPSQDYLFRVIEDLVKLDGKAKTLFFGDVRSYALHREFLAARALQISSKYANVSLEDFQHIMDDLERAESELLIDPGFFTGLRDHLPDHIEHVEIIPKMMSATNELSSYRYTAIVHVQAQHPPSTANSQHIHEIEKDDWINFEEQGLNYHTLVQILQAQEQVLEMLRLQLPSYMVPRTITVLDKMPINSSGKLDRQALAKQRVNGKLRRPVEQQPTTEVQRQLQSIWAKVLVIDPSTVGLDDNFFHLGGSSIAAMRVAAEIRKAGYHVTVADIFRHPALRDLSSQTHPMATNVTEEFAPFSLLGDGFNKMEFLQELSNLYGIDPALVCDAYPSTSLQEGLLSLTSKQNTDYVLRAVFKLSSSIDAQKLRNAWETIFYSLPILRTRIIQHRTLGTVQIVMHEKIQWDSASNIDEYLKTDSKLQMGPGQPLTRQDKDALV